jgi:SAM-dependent methyltransferase
MAHSEQAMFVGIVRDVVVKSKSLDSLAILEMGSFDVNGTVRSLFKGASYIGVDIAPGPGVDVVAFGHEFQAPDESFDVVLSCECFEHDPYWVDTFGNMFRLAKPGAVIAFTCASTGRLEHGTRRTNPADSPGTQSKGIDYYRNLTEHDFRSKVQIDNHCSHYRFYYLSDSSDLYFIGSKHGSSAGIALDLTSVDLEVANLRRKSKEIRKRRHGLLFRSLFAVYRFPIKTLSLICPDAVFQNLAFWYRRITKMGR